MYQITERWRCQQVTSPHANLPVGVEICRCVRWRATERAAMIGAGRRRSVSLRVPDNGRKGSPPRPSAEWRKAKQEQERDGEPSADGATTLPDNISYLVH